MRSCDRGYMLTYRRNAEELGWARVGTEDNVGVSGVHDIQGVSG